MMNWWNTLKVDIDFEMAHGKNLPKKRLASYNYARQYYTDGTEEDVEQRIKIHPDRIFRWLKAHLGREPTDEEIEELTVESIRHESGHAAHHQIEGKDYHNMSIREQEDFAEQFETYEPGRPQR